MQMLALSYPLYALSVWLARCGGPILVPLLEQDRCVLKSSDDFAQRNGQPGRCHSARWWSTLEPLASSPSGDVFQTIRWVSGIDPVGRSHLVHDVCPTVDDRRRREHRIVQLDLRRERQGKLQLFVRGVACSLRILHELRPIGCAQGDRQRRQQQDGEKAWLVRCAHRCP